MLTGKTLDGNGDREFLFLEQDKLPLADNYQDSKEIARVIKNALKVASSRKWAKKDVVVVIKAFRPLYEGGPHALEVLEEACDGTTLISLCGEDYKNYLGPTMWDLLMCSSTIGSLVAAKALSNKTII